jgi:GntR family transcriptional regulator / MocR family aminotransferase
MNKKPSFIIDKIIEKYNLECKKVDISKYLILYQTIKNCIQDKTLIHQTNLPASRNLATALDISRSTVLKAFELLTLEKLIISRKGSGYLVNFFIEKSSLTKDINDGIYPEISEKGKSFLKNVIVESPNSSKSFAFRPGLPPLDIFPVNQWKSLLNLYWKNIKSSSLSNAPTSDLNPLKINICNYLNICRNIICEPDQLLIVSGSLQSLYLIANAILNKGDTVIIENPTFPNVISIFNSSQANLISLPIDNEGITIEKLDVNQDQKPKLIHVTPSNHYPLGVKMSLKRRKEVIDWASRNKAFIIENDYENEMSSTNISLPSIYSLDQEDRTIYLGTFNRILHPNIRLSYIIVPKYLIKTIKAIQEHSHKFVNPSIQLVMSQFIEKNYLYLHLKNIIKVAQEREILFRNLFNENTNHLKIEERPFSSLHLVAKFTNQVSVEEEYNLLQLFKENNIVADSLSNCFLGEKKESGFIFGYSSVRTSLMQQKVIQMTKIINSFLK